MSSKRHSDTLCVKSRTVQILPAANLRIDEYRQMQVNFDIKTPGADRIEVKMTKNNFIFGAAVNGLMRTEMDRIEDFFEIFNYGVLGNEMKWFHQEFTRDNFNYEDSDWFMDWFDEHGVPLRGHTLFWSVDQFVQGKGRQSIYFFGTGVLKNLEKRKRKNLKAPKI